MNLKLEIKWALIFTMATLFWSLLEKVTGLTSTHIDKFPYFTNIFAVLAITIYILAMKAKRKNLGGVLPWKKGIFIWNTNDWLYIYSNPIKSVYYIKMDHA